MLTTVGAHWRRLDTARTRWLFAFVLFIAVDLLLRRSWISEQHASSRFFFNYGASALFLALQLRSIFALPRKVRAPVLAGFVVLPLLTQYALFSVYSQFASAADYVTLRSDPKGAWQAIAAAAAWWPSARNCGLLLAACTPIALAADSPLPKARLRTRASWVCAWLVVTLTSAAVGARYWYSAPTFQQPLLAAASAVFSIGQRSAQTAKPGTKPVLLERRAAPGATPSIVIVIGESLSKHRLHLYGYARPTTPNLDELAANGELIAMQDALVLGNTTRVSVPYILTGLEGPDPVGRVYNTPTILEYAKARGYDTATVSAQDLRWGELDSFFRHGTRLFRSGLDVDARVDILKGIDDLSMLQKETIPVLGKLREPFLLIVQLDGSHMPYAAHSPAELKAFLPESTPNDDNAYDNSIRVTDLTVATLARAVRAQSPNAWMFFTTDHGQSLGQGGAFYSRGFQSNITDNALMVFPPVSARELIAQRARAQTSSADIAATAYELMGVAPVTAIDGQSLISATFAPTRDRVVSAYTPTLANEPMMLWVDKSGASRLYDFEHDQVTLGDGRVTSRTAEPLPPSIEKRLSR